MFSGYLVSRRITQCLYEIADFEVLSHTLIHLPFLLPLFHTISFEFHFGDLVIWLFKWIFTQMLLFKFSIPSPCDTAEKQQQRASVHFRPIPSSLTTPKSASAYSQCGCSNMCSDTVQKDV